MKARVTILTFHALDHERTVISFPPALFERMARTLHEGGLPVISLGDAVRGLRGEAVLPVRSVAITFDDGYRSVYEVAFPILREHGLPATVFLTLGSPEDAQGRGASDTAARLPSMEGRRMLSWREIREMHRAGIDFGAHTLSHPDLTCLSTADMEREMLTSKNLLEEVLAGTVTTFAYPFGRYDEQSVLLARKLFECACTDRLGFASRSGDLFSLPRVDAYYLRHAWLAGSLAKPWFPWYIRARAIPRRIRRRALALLK